MTAEVKKLLDEYFYMNPVAGRVKALKEAQRKITWTLDEPLTAAMLEDYFRTFERRDTLKVPKAVEEWFIDLILSTGVLDESPAYSVGNFLQNGTHGSFDDFRNEGETDAELITRLEAEDDVMYIDKENRYIVQTIV